MPLLVRTSDQSLESLMNSYDIAMVAWSFEKVRIRDVRLFNVLAKQVVRDGANGNINKTYNSQDLSNIVLAFCKAGLPIPEVFDTVAKR